MSSQTQYDTASAGIFRFMNTDSGNHDQEDKQQQHPQPPIGSAYPMVNPARGTSTALTDDSHGSSGAKRPLAAVSSKSLSKDLSEKKLRRLEKNRLSARECRRRKREATENLSKQIKDLEDENLRLRIQLKIGSEAEESQVHAELKAMERLTSMVKAGASESDVSTTFDEIKEKYFDYGQNRRTAQEFHLLNIKRLLMPVHGTAVVMRALEGGAQFLAAGYTPEETLAAAQNQPLHLDLTSPQIDPKDLFQFLARYLEITPEQAAAFKETLTYTKEMDHCLFSALSVLEELAQRQARVGNILDTEHETVMRIVSPSQIVKFLTWVANNKACLHVLNELWNRVYPLRSESDESQEDSESNGLDSFSD